MIVLDTNVLSEALKPQPAAEVLLWLDQQDRDSVFTTAITRAEILYGIELLAPGRHRTRLYDSVEGVFSELLRGRILPFDEEAAVAYAPIVGNRKRAGRPISQFDAMIAAICRSRSAILATRNLRDFRSCGIELLDPWQR